jgi:alkanesulfonate monooxygenase SsuD/methylene tetrahydromethanopterin reductase-like flavin-dependent oxidoreductase (luciferase family)
VTPKPPRQGGPPIWIGAFVEAAVRRAGRLADGFMATEAGPDSLAEQARWAREELERAGRDPAAFTWSIHLPTFAWHGDDAWERVREHVWYVNWKYEDMEHARGPRTAAPPPYPAARDQEQRDGVVLGTPEQVAEQIAALRDAVGGDLHYIARLYYPGMDPAVRDEAMRIFAEEVRPLLDG